MWSSRARSFAGHVALVGIVSAGAWGCAATDDAASAGLDDVPLPAGTSPVATLGEVTPPGVLRKIYVADEGSDLATVDRYFERELPPGADHDGWSWCGATSARADERAWKRGARVLTIEYFEQEGSLLDIPRGRVVVIVTERPSGRAVSDEPRCRRGAGR